MKTYEYRGYTVAGKRTKGMIEALNPKAAKDVLAREGILVDSLNESGSRAAKVRGELRGVLYRELAALLEAGLPLVTALDTLINTPEMRSVSGILGAVRDQVREGSSLASALGSSKVGTTTFEKATIEVAERTAALDTVLQQLADFIDDHQRMKERIQQALIYPALVLGLGVIVSVVMLGFLLPRTQKMMSGVNVEMPLLTRIMLMIGDSLWPWGLVAFLLLILGCGWFLRRIKSSSDMRIKYDRMLFGLPLFGLGYRLMVSIRFARTLAIMVRSGVPLVEGVVLAGRSTGSAWVAHDAELQAEVLRHGQPLSVAVRGIPPLAEMLPGWIEIGEVSGSLEAMLQRSSERSQARFDRFLSRALVLLEPALLLLIGGFVLLIVLAVMLPMFSLSSAIAK